jgi:cardiolipin synthase
MNTDSGPGVRRAPVAAVRTTSLPWYESVGSEFEDGHDIELLESGREFFPALIKAINGAQNSIFIETYIFGDEGSAVDVAQALHDAAHRGVTVRCVVDGYGTRKLSGEVQRLMSDGKVRLETYRPEPSRFSFDRQRLRRLHRKLAVIDGEIVFAGGINLIDDLRDIRHGQLDAPRFDYAVKVRGPLVAHAHLTVNRLWWELRFVNRSLRKARPSGAQSTDDLPSAYSVPAIVQSNVTATGEHRATLITRDNFLHRRTIERWYLSAIRSAKKDVIIANAYFLPGVRFRRALINAVRRGVRVRLLLQGKVDYKMQYLATQALYDRLLSEGVEIIEYQASFLHAKVAAIDDLCTVGSSNIDPFSLLMAREANVVVDDKAFADQLRTSLEAAIDTGGKVLELTEHRQRPLPDRIKNWFAFVALRLAVSLTGKAGRY